MTFCGIDYFCIMDELEFELSQAVGKTIQDIDIFMDVDAMDVFFMAMDDGSELFIRNKKRNKGDDLTIFSAEELSEFKGAQIVSYEIVEDAFNVDFDSAIIEELIFETSKGKFALQFENMGIESSDGWLIALLLIYWTHNGTLSNN